MGLGICGITGGLITTAASMVKAIESAEPSTIATFIAPVAATLTVGAFKIYIDETFKKPKLNAIHNKVRNTYYKIVDDGFRLPGQATEIPPQS